MVVRGSQRDVIRPSWLTNNALVYEPKRRVGEGGGGCRILANENSCAYGAQINFGDLTQYLACDGGGKGGVPPPISTFLYS
jgi:hypothetical protein